MHLKMEHPLDNPVWNALISGNSHLSHGNDVVKYFSKDVSPFVGLRENTEENLNLLHEMLPYNHQWAVMSPEEIPVSKNWKILDQIDIFQMIHLKTSPENPDDETIMALHEENVPAMLYLTKLTQPGPFESQTIRFGHYEGIFIQDRLASMAGQRLHPFEYAEISAVCTHPDFSGRGLATKILSHQIHRIKSASGIPILHVDRGHPRTIHFYEHLGFEIRKALTVFIIENC